MEGIDTFLIKTNLKKINGVFWYDIHGKEWEWDGGGRIVAPLYEGLFLSGPLRPVYIRCKTWE